jgi:hypothetical protein
MILTTTEKQELAKKLGVKKSDIQESPFEENILLVENSKGYAVVNKADIGKDFKDKIINTYGLEYFIDAALTTEQKNKMLDDLGANIISNTESFITDNEFHILDNMEEFNNEEGPTYTEISTYIYDQEPVLKPGDLQNAEALWDAEILFIPPYYNDEFKKNIVEKYGLNADKITSYIYKNFISAVDMLSDYSESISLGDKMIYRRDVEYVNEAELELETKISNDMLPVIEEAVSEGDYWHGYEHSIDETSPHGYDINIYFTNEEDMKDGVTIVAYGLKVDTSEDAKPGVYLVDTENTIHSFVLTEEEIKKLISSNKKNKSTANTTKK